MGHEKLSKKAAVLVQDDCLIWTLYLGLGGANCIIHGVVLSLSLWVLSLFEKNSSILCLGPQRCLGTCLDTAMAVPSVVEAFEVGAFLADKHAVPPHP